MFYHIIGIFWCVCIALAGFNHIHDSYRKKDRHGIMEGSFVSLLFLAGIYCHIIKM